MATTGGQSLAPLEIRTPQTGDKPAKKQTMNQRPRPVPDVLLGNKKTNKPARCDSPDASVKRIPRIPQRLPKGIGNVITLSNRYSSL